MNKLRAFLLILVIIICACVIVQCFKEYQKEIKIEQMLKEPFVMIATRTYILNKNLLHDYRVIMQGNGKDTLPSEAWLKEVNLLMDTEGEKLLVLSSLVTLTKLVNDEMPVSVTQLHEKGINKLAYNMEGGLTPASEIAVPAESVREFVSIAGENGFEVLWAPIRMAVDKRTDAEIVSMAGLWAVGLQEQKAIEESCAKDRISAVLSTAARYKRLGVPNIIVQIMPGRCLNGDLLNCRENITVDYGHCMLFWDGIKDNVEGLSVFTSSDSEAERAGKMITLLMGKFYLYLPLVENGN